MFFTIFFFLKDRIKIDKDTRVAEFADEFLIQREKYKKKIQKIEGFKKEVDLKEYK